MKRELQEKISKHNKPHGTVKFTNKKEVFEMKKFVKVLKAIGDEIIFLLTGKGELADEMIDEGLIDYSGQGRDEYGK
jgi:hypothetical protein